MTLRIGARPALAAALLASTPVSAQETVADLDTAVRCAAAFSLVAMGQAQGDAGAMAFPPLADRGREFFVQVGARVIDERGLTNAEVRVLFLDQANALLELVRTAPDQAAALRGIVQPCLTLLDATVPAGNLPANG